MEKINSSEYWNFLKITTTNGIVFSPDIGDAITCNTNIISLSDIATITYENVLYAIILIQNNNLLFIDENFIKTSEIIDSSKVLINYLITDELKESLVINATIKYGSEQAFPKKSEVIEENTDINDSGIKKFIANLSSIDLDTTIDTLEDVFENANEYVASTIKYTLSPSSGSFSSAVVDTTLNTINDIVVEIGSAVNYGADVVNSVASSLSDVLEEWSDVFGTSSSISNMIGSGLNIFATALNDYDNGVDETSFGSEMESTWYGSATSFLNTFKSGSGNVYTINILNSTPLDAGNEQTSLYGSMVLGVPPLFTHTADPENRALSNSFLKDARFLSLTPGLPKYNGSAYTQKGDTITTPLKDGDSMVEYLLRNGLDSYFSDKDKRYYTFEAKYAEYFSYLEAMLNPLWIKLGLGTKKNNEFNIFSFFDIKNSSSSSSALNPTNFNSLKSKYQSSIGFYINPTSILAENIDSTQTSFGSDLASRSNSYASTFQQINYKSGMGTGGTAKNASRVLANIFQTSENMASFFSDSFSNMATGWNSSGNIISRIAQAAIGASKDIIKMNTQEDLGAYLQSFATTNGMMVQYPELWENSTYGKSANINFEFVSPYGDPLSVFQYVYVPFCALLCFAMPRQAANNGFVSPFLIRADVPGLFTSDLGLITNLTWTKGGNQGLYTKDGLPRSITGSFNITDLYPYLAMSKRFSYLSANPSYTVFLDNMAGLHAVYQEDNIDSLNNYWKQMINRVSGEDNGSITGLWNTYDNDKRQANSEIYENQRTSNLIKLKPGQINWLRKGS